DAETLFAQAKDFGRWSVAASDPAGDVTEASGRGARFSLPPPEVAIDRRAHDPLEQARAWLAQPGTRKLVVAESPGRRETLEQLFSEHGVRLEGVDDWQQFVDSEPDAAITVGPIFDGFELPEVGVSIVTETELFAG